MRGAVDSGVGDAGPIKCLVLAAGHRRITPLVAQLWVRLKWHPQPAKCHPCRIRQGQTDAAENMEQGHVNDSSPDAAETTTCHTDMSKVLRGLCRTGHHPHIVFSESHLHAQIQFASFSQAPMQQDTTTI